MNEVWWSVGFSITQKLQKCFTYQSSVPSSKATVKWEKEVKVKFVEDSF